MKSRPTTLLIGGGGFIGSAIANHFAARNCDERILVIGRSASPKYQLNSRIEYFKKDLEGFAVEENLFSQVTNIIDLSGDTSPASEALLPSEFMQSQVAPTIERMAIASKYPIKKYIYFSSGGAIYGSSKETPLKEEDNLDPISQYGLQKLYCEQYAKFLHATAGFPVLIARPGNPYGKNQVGARTQGFIGAAISAALRSEKIKIYGENGTVRDYIYIDDLVSAVEALIKKDAPVGTYNIGTGIGYNNLEVIELLRKILKPLDLEIALEREGARMSDVPVNILNIEKIKSATAWQAEIGLEEGLRRTIIEYQNK